MVSKNRRIYRFSSRLQVLITVVPRNSCRLACSQNKWYSDPTDTSLGARLCVVCARRPLFTAVCHNFGYPICHRERGVRGVSSVVCYAVLCPWSGGLWCVMPCYAMVGWKSLISGDFPSDQGTGPEQQGTIGDKE